MCLIMDFPGPIEDRQSPARLNVTTKSSHRLPECREPSSACPSSGFHLSRVIRSPPRSRSRSPDLRAPTEHSRQHPNASLRCRRNYQTRNPGTCQGITNSTSHRTTCHCGRVACVPLVTEPSRQYPSPPLRHKGSKATTETVDTRQPPLTTLADYQPQGATPIERNMASPQILPSPPRQQLPPIRTIFANLESRPHERRLSTQGTQSFTSGRIGYSHTRYRHGVDVDADRYCTSNEYAPRDAQYSATIADGSTYSERQPYPSPPENRSRRDTNRSRPEDEYTAGARNGINVQSVYASTRQQRLSRDRDVPANSYNTPPPSTTYGSVSPSRDVSPRGGRASPNYLTRRLSGREQPPQFARPERYSVEGPPRSGYYQAENQNQNRQYADYRQYSQPVHPEEYPQLQNLERPRQPGPGQYGQPISHDQYSACHGYARRDNPQPVTFTVQSTPSAQWHTVYGHPPLGSPFTMIDGSSSLAGPNGHVLSMQSARYHASSNRMLVPLVEVETSRANRSQRRGNLPKAATNAFKDWIHTHKNAPYPSEEQKQAWSDDYGLTISQISNWFINARRRILPPKPKGTNNDRPSASHDEHADDDDDNDNVEGPSGRHGRR